MKRNMSAPSLKSLGMGMAMSCVPRSASAWCQLGNFQTPSYRTSPSSVPGMDELRSHRRPLLTLPQALANQAHYIGITAEWFHLGSWIQ